MGNCNSLLEQQLLLMASQRQTNLLLPKAGQLLQMHQNEVMHGSLKQKALICLQLLKVPPDFFLRECVMDVPLSQFSRHGVMVSFGHWPTRRSAFLTNLATSQLIGNYLRGLQNLSKEFQDPSESIKGKHSLVSYVWLLVESMLSLGS